VLKILLKT